MYPQFNIDKWIKLRNPKFERLGLSKFRDLGIKPLIGFIVVNDIEKKTMLNNLRAFPKTHKKYRIPQKAKTYYLGMFGAFPVVVVQSGMGTDGPRDATMTVIETIKTWKISVVVAVGVAMGLKKKKQHFGDVLVSEMIQNYDKRKVYDGTTIDRSARPLSSNVLYDRFKDNDDWKYLDHNGRRCSVITGLIITGNALVNDPELAKNLKTQYPNAIGNEMEASGVWAASANSNVHWIIVKGICDWGVNKGDKYQPLAASAAVSLCKSIFSNDMALEGIIVRKTTNHKKNVIPKINSLNLFFLRNEKGINLQTLASKTGISEIRLKELEAFKSSLKFDYSEFPLCTMAEIRKIEKIICKGYRDLTVSHTPKDYMGYLLSYYYKRKMRVPYSWFKAVIFDFDGTLTKDELPGQHFTTWQRIWLKLGYSIDDCRSLHDRFSQNEFSHQKWCDITCERFQEKGFTRRTLNEIASEIPLIEGVIPTLKKLKEHNIHLFIASGSIKDVIVNVIGKENVHLFEEIQANRMEFDQNGNLSQICGTQYDFKGKCDYIEKIAQTFRINPFQILFIGNSNNDQLAYESGAVTLCVNPRDTDPRNRKIWHNTIYEMQNFNSILDYISL